MQFRVHTTGADTGDAQQAALRNAGFAASEAVNFASRYAVVTSVSDSGTSFQATVFKDASGNLTVAIRGTLEAGDYVPTDIAIATQGAGYDQIVAMRNWWSRATAPAGQMVQQFTVASYAPTATQPTNGVLLYSGIGLVYYLQPAPAVVATGELVAALAADSDHKVEVVAHSLGGHLALAFNKLFPTAANLVSTFNAPGFLDTTTNQQFFAMIGGEVPTPANSGNVTNVMADEAVVGSVAWSAVAGLHSRPGTAVNIGIENQWLSDEPNVPDSKNHSQMILVDSLAVLNLLTQLDPTLSTADYKTILNRAVQGTAASYEKVVDALEALFGINTTLLPTGNNNRDALYSAIYALQSNALFGTVADQLQIAPTGVSASSLVDLASDIGTNATAYRYALRELSPFAVLGNASLFLAHNSNGDLNLFVNAATTPAGMTTQYISDRAAMLAWLNLSKGQDSGLNLARGDVSGATDFEDKSSGDRIKVYNPGEAADFRKISFGGDDADGLTGSVLSDRLYGGRGSDMLVGGSADDYLEGGAGMDVYGYTAKTALFVQSNDGADTIRDTDGKGVIRYEYKDGSVEFQVG